jgi:UDP-MurNAc hydroxylase
MMKIQLISHASVMIETSDCALWTDPWLQGKVFNDSWTLLPAHGFHESILQRITHLWISHEHPDHLNFATLSALPDDFKARVVVLFQDNDSRRTFESLRKLGYRNFVTLPHRRIVNIGAATRVYCYRAGTIDSCLAVMSAGDSLLDVNDAKLGTRDCHVIRNDLASVDVVLNQFSMAVCHPPADYWRYLSSARRQVLENLSANHRDLRARVTIPFASLMYWSSLDNRYLNEFSNKPGDVKRFCDRRGQQSAILFPGDVYEIGQPYDSGPALQRYEHLFAGLNQFSFDVPVRIPLDQIRESFGTMVEELHQRFPGYVLRLLRPLRIRIPDLGITVQLSFARGSLTEAEDTIDPDLSIYSQPLEFCFAKPYGVQTLAISGRYLLLKGQRNWRLHRAMLALHSANLNLRFSDFFSQRNWSYLKRRLSGWQFYRDVRA